jgi:GNAT superfamily N-acetyltransferase
VRPASRLVARPLTPARWSDLEQLFGSNGAYANCWCTFQRITGREFSAGCANGGAGNRALLRRLTGEGRRPGLIGYRDGRPVGWVSVGPRPDFGRILRSPITRLTPAQQEDTSVWSVVCFFIPRRERGQGVGTALLDAAITYARERRAATLEAYPVDTRGKRIASSTAYTGTVELFRRAGFRRAKALRPDRPVMRLPLGSRVS